MNRTHFAITIVFNLLLTAIMMNTPDNKVSIVYAQQIDNNIVEVGSSNTSKATKANATETDATAATKANATE